MKVNGHYWTIVEFQHVKPGKGGAFVRTRLKNLLTGQVKDNTFRSGERVEEVRVERRQFQFLYTADDMYYVMDKTTFDQVPLPAGMVEDIKGYMKENIEIDILHEGDKPLYIEIPNFIEFEVKDTEPGFKGDTAQGATKPATMETGLVVQVPLFIDTGDLIRVDTRTGKYMTRV